MAKSQMRTAAFRNANGPRDIMRHLRNINILYLIYRLYSPYLLYLPYYISSNIIYRLFIHIWPTSSFTYYKTLFRLVAIADHVRCDRRKDRRPNWHGLRESGT